MSSPSSVGGNNNASVGIREGTRVILREITANLQNSPPGTSPRRKTGNEAASSTKSDNHQQQPQQQQHDVKVRFIREFAEATSPRAVERIPENSSLSSASSFQSLASTLSSKCSSGICVDSSPRNNADRSYLNLEIAGLDDIISACENIHLEEPSSRERSFELRVDSEDSSNFDETFASAADRSTLNITRSNSPLTPTNANDNLNAIPTTPARRERTPSPLNPPDDLHRNLNVTRDLPEVTSPTIAEDPPADCNLNVTRNVDEPPRAVNCNLKPTEEATREKSPLKVDVPERIEDLNVTRELAILINDQNGENVDLNVTAGLENDACGNWNLVDPELNVTKDIDSQICTAGRNEASELDATRIITSDEDFSTIRCRSLTLDDLDITREVTRESTDIPQEASGPEKVADQPPPEPVDPSPQEEEPESKKVDASLGPTAETSPTARDDERFAGYEEYPLELITPSISQFHENLCPPVTEETRNIRESPAKDSTIIRPVETTTDDFADFSGTSDINEVTENSPLPALPSLSSIRLNSELEEGANQLPQASVTNVEEKAIPELPVRSPTPKDEEKLAEKSTAVTSVADEFIAAFGSDCTPGKALSTIEEQSYVSVPTLLDSSVGINCSVLVTSPKAGDSQEVADCRSLRVIVKEEVPEYVAEPIQEDPFDPQFTAVSGNEVLAVKKETNEDAEESSPRVASPKPESCGTAEAEIEKESFPDDKRDHSNEDLDTTVTAEDADEPPPIVGNPEHYSEFLPQRQSTALVVQPKLETQISCIVAGAGDDKTFITRPISLTDDYTAFLPQKQSTTLDGFTSPLSSKLQRQRTPFVTALTAPEETLPNGTSTKTTPIKRREIVVDRSNFAQLELAANSVANDIFNSSLDFAEENDHFVSAESELFHDPSNFDFLLSKTPRKNAKSNLREVSLYVKFDPLVSNTSMLPQGNIQNASPTGTNNEAARNGENNTAIPNIGTPKRNPAIAAIDRLLFYSPMPTNTTTANTNIQKTNDAQEKLKAAEETSEDTINMAKELELVRTTVLQLEDQLEKLKIEHEEALEQQTSYKEKINQLQAQLAQEIKHKNEITVVVDEYEISISRLVAERERDRKNLDLEKAKLQEELAAAKHHLDNTEAAFNDVHLKYERLKAVVATYKNNEAALKESLQENVEIIKSLEHRYEQVKSHATARLEKANQDLEEIRNQNESETVKLRAMLRKAELKSNSLAELVEQKTKENKELTQILDEVIARVGCNKAE